MRLPKIVMVASFAVLASPGVMAQGLHAVRPLHGFVCMKLNLSEAQSLDSSVHVPVYASPSGDTQPVGWASMTVAVRLPIRDINGFQEMLFPTGKYVWIASKNVAPWSSLSDPTARCVPSLMSNGRPGFVYNH